MMYVQLNRLGEYIPFSYSIKDICVYEGIEEKPYLPYGTIKNGYKVKTQDMNTQQAVKNLDIPTGYELYGETDYYYKKLDKWFIHNEWNKAIFKNLEWSVEEVSTDKVRYLCGSLKSKINDDISNAKCNILSVVTENENKNGIFLDTEKNLICYIDSLLDETDITKFMQLLNDTNAYMIYPLNTPTETEITDITFIEELESLTKLESYYPETNISVEKVTENDETELPILEVEYYKSIQSMQDEINELKEKINN